MATSHMQTIVTIYNHMEWHATINPFSTIWLHMKQIHSTVRNHIQLYGAIWLNMQPFDSHIQAHSIHFKSIQHHTAICKHN